MYFNLKKITSGNISHRVPPMIRWVTEAKAQFKKSSADIKVLLDKEIEYYEKRLKAEETLFGTPHVIKRLQALREQVK